MRKPKTEKVRHAIKKSIIESVRKKALEKVMEKRKEEIPPPVPSCEHPRMVYGPNGGYCPDCPHAFDI
jgi:uncharacterized sporulation protein YeaH/YhbH (DUF444 family)